MVLETPDISSFLPSSFDMHKINIALLFCAVMVGCRNSALLLFFFVIKIFENERQTLENERIALEKKGFICVPDHKDTVTLISIFDILYIVHEKNYTYIHTLDGTKYCKYTSLSNMALLLPDNLFLRINRQTIIPVNKITQFSENNVTIYDGNPAHKYTFPLSDNLILKIKIFCLTLTV